jgi:prepilin-type N-terminal cleavage/methylation domain-containing protein
MAARRGGFSLVECLVALAILAAAAGGFYRVFATVAAGARLAEARQMAALRAASVLERVGRDIPLREGARAGQGWRLAISRHGDAADRQAWPVAAYEVRVEAAAAAGGPVRLMTIRLGPKPAER